MVSGLVVVEDYTVMRAINPVSSPTTRRGMTVALALGPAAGAYGRFERGLPWSFAISLAAAVGGFFILAPLAFHYLGRRSPQTWWFRSDSIQIQRGPFRRRINWESIRRWQLTPITKYSESSSLTIWYQRAGGEQVSSIVVPPGNSAAEIKRLLQGYERTV